MACGNITFFLVAVLASLTIIRGEEGSGLGQIPQYERDDEIVPGDRLSVQSQFGSFNLPFDQLIAAFSQFIPNNSSDGGLSIPHLPHLSRNAEVGNVDQNEETPEGRLFFSSFSYSRTCNYTANPGRSCLTCRQAQTCRPNNVATVRRCSFFKPYCLNGRCSKHAGPLCDATTSTTAAATTTAATTTVAASTTVAATTAGA